MSKKVLSIGQCGADNYNLSRFLESAFQAEVIPADSPEEALTHLRHHEVALILVNRILDATGDSGLDFIQEINGDPKTRDVPVMLVSNFADAQAQAVTRGALPGFGKAALNDPRTIERLAPLLS